MSSGIAESIKSDVLPVVLNVRRLKDNLVDKDRTAEHGHLLGPSKANRLDLCNVDWCGKDVLAYSTTGQRFGGGAQGDFVTNAKPFKDGLEFTFLLVPFVGAKSYSNIVTVDG